MSLRSALQEGRALAQPLRLRLGRRGGHHGWRQVHADDAAAVGGSLPAQRAGLAMRSLVQRLGWPSTSRLRRRRQQKRAVRLRKSQA